MYDCSNKRSNCTNIKLYTYCLLQCHCVFICIHIILYIYMYIYTYDQQSVTHHIFLTNCEHGSGRHVSSVTAKTDFSPEIGLLGSREDTAVTQAVQK